MSTSHYSSRDYDHAPRSPHTAHTAYMRAVAPDWDEPLSGVAATNINPTPDDIGAHTVRIPLRRERALDRIRVYMECLWLFVFTSALILFDAAGVVYFWGEPEVWVFISLTLPAWVLSLAVLNKINRM